MNRTTFENAIKEIVELYDTYEETIYLDSAIGWFLSAVKLTLTGDCFAAQRQGDFGVKNIGFYLMSKEKKA